MPRRRFLHRQSPCTCGDAPKRADSQELSATVSLNTLLSPTLTVYKEIDRYKQWYFLLGISHTLELNKVASLNGVYTLIETVANTNTTILILGESGVGKERVAHAIHYSSTRADKPFVSVNCAALPESLIESELFGHEKGAFTGATMARKGRFEIADRGTIFLDEIGELSLSVQTKLLRIIQEKEFERIGGNTTLKSDVRIIATTNRDLATSHHLPPNLQAVDAAARDHSGAFSGIPAWKKRSSSTN